MTHLSDEQLDSVLRGEGADPQHLALCPQCRARLDERRAIGGRLRTAFESVRAGEKLTATIRNSLIGDAHEVAARASRPGLFRWLMPLTAAAVVLLAVVAAVILLPSPRTAQAELYAVYMHSLSEDTQLFTHADPQELATYLKEELGFDVAIPRLGAGMSLRGCCVVHFQDEPVGSYVVDTPDGVISVIVIAQSMESLGMTEQLRRGDRVYGIGSFAVCNMASVELDGYTYCAVGEVPHAMLTGLLEQLVR